MIYIYVFELWVKLKLLPTSILINLKQLVIRWHISEMSPYHESYFSNYIATIKIILIIRLIQQADDVEMTSK